MKVPQKIKQRVYKKVDECIQAAQLYYPNHFITTPTISFDVRGKKAGYAMVQANAVHFNPVLLMENLDDFIERTVPHEIAHVIDFIVNPQNFKSTYNHTTGRFSKRTYHGKTFKFIMSEVLGADDNSTYHNYDTTNATVRKSRKFVWKSTIDGHEMILGIKRHNKMLKGWVRYWLRGKSHHTYTFSHEKGAQLMAASTKRPTSRPTGSTQKGNAQKIFNGCDDRKTFIKRAQAELGMKATTASTYWYNFNSGKW